MPPNDGTLPAWASRPPPASPRSHESTRTRRAPASRTSRKLCYKERRARCTRAKHSPDFTQFVGCSDPALTNRIGVVPRSPPEQHYRDQRRRDLGVDGAWRHRPVGRVSTRSRTPQDRRPQPGRRRGALDELPEGHPLSAATFPKSARLGGLAARAAFMVGRRRRHQDPLHCSDARSGSFG